MFWGDSAFSLLLSPCYIFVKVFRILAFTSSVRPLRFGVPQGVRVGSVAVSLVFGDLIRCHDMDFHLYADDTQP